MIILLSRIYLADLFVWLVWVFFKSVSVHCAMNPALENGSERWVLFIGYNSKYTCEADVLGSDLIRFRCGGVVIVPVLPALGSVLAKLGTGC